MRKNKKSGATQFLAVNYYYIYEIKDTENELFKKKKSFFYQSKSSALIFEIN